MADFEVTNSPAWQSPKLVRHKGKRERCQHALGGLDVLREHASRYLPKLPRETTENYEIRRHISECLNLMGATVSASEGLIIADPPKLKPEVSQDLRDVWADVDGRQTGGEVWLRGLVRDMLTDGWLVGVVSTPVRSGQRPTLDQVAKQRMRPYLSLYRADSVRSVRFQRFGGREVLTQIVFEENVEEPSGLYGMKTVTQYRVLRRVRSGQHVSFVMVSNERNEWSMRGAPEVIETDELPVVEFSALPTAGFGQAPPPLVAQADFTISHWNLSTDQRWNIKQGAFPWFVRIGYRDDGPTTASPTEALDLPIGGDAKWIGPPGTAFEPSDREMGNIERRSAMMSFSFISGEAGAVEKTATATRIDQQGQDASLAAMAIGLRDALNRTFAIIDEMLGNEPQDEYFDVRTSFRGMLRDPAFLRVVLDAWKEHAIPTDALIHAFKTGELPEDLDVEDAALRAIAEAEAQAAADAEKAKQQGRIPADSAVDDQPLAA